MLKRFLDYLSAHSAEIISRLLLAAAIATLTLAVGYLAARLVGKALERRVGRGKTLAPIVRTLIWLFTIFAAVVMGFDQVGVDVRTILAGAGVIGLALGFGAQTLVKDCLSGFFLILDNVLMVGDVVEIESQSGVVERVGLRLTLVRSETGKLWYIPNGSITKVGNASRNGPRIGGAESRGRGAVDQKASAPLPRTSTREETSFGGERTAPANGRIGSGARGEVDGDRHA